MILMNWIRKDNGGFTTFRARMSRGTLAHFVREQLVAHMQTIYCHEQAALAIYKELAANATPARRDVFLRPAQASLTQRQSAQAEERVGFAQAQRLLDGVK